METRNIIKSGPSSYVVSLPLSWIKKNKLEKGDFLFLEEKDNILSYSTKNSVDENKSITIDIDNKSDEDLKRRLISAYLTNYHTFVLKGQTLKTRIKGIREIISQLVAVEIMEQTSSKMVLLEMLDKNKNSPEKIIRRIDMIVRNMFDEINSSIGKADVSEYISEKESDINKLQRLGQRLVINALENPSYLEELKKKSCSIMMELKVINFLEMIGDSLSSCSKYSNKVNSVQIIKFFQELGNDFKNLMESYYSEDFQKAITFSISYQKKRDHIENMIEKSKESKSLLFIIMLREIITSYDEISLIILNRNT